MLKQKNVLIVDDEGENLLVLESILEELPITIYKAFNGRDALKIILKNHVDIILLDVQMPVMNGFEIADLIRNRVKTQETPIVFLTGMIDDDYFDFKKKYPKNIECLQKPLDIEDLLKVVNYFLNIT